MPEKTENLPTPGLYKLVFDPVKKIYEPVLKEQKPELAAGMECPHDYR